MATISTQTTITPNDYIQPTYILAQNIEKAGPYRTNSPYDKYLRHCLFAQMSVIIVLVSYPVKSMLRK